LADVPVSHWKSVKVAVVVAPVGYVPVMSSVHCVVERPTDPYRSAA